jgi:hypothetical protein
VVADEGGGSVVLCRGCLIFTLFSHYFLFK